MEPKAHQHSQCSEKEKGNDVRLLKCSSSKQSRVQEIKDSPYLRYVDEDFKKEQKEKERERERKEQRELERVQMLRHSHEPVPIQQQQRRLEMFTLAMRIHPPSPHLSSSSHVVRPLPLRIQCVGNVLSNEFCKDKKLHFVNYR
jgi:hypothetical protein